MNALVSFRKCTLTDEELLKEVDQLTDQMYENGKIPARHIPARPNKDYDLLVGELIYRFNQLLNKPQNPEECDATTDDKNGEAGDKIPVQYCEGEDDIAFDFHQANPDPLGNGELDKWCLQNIADAEKERDEEENETLRMYLNGVISAFKDVRVKIKK